MTKIAVLADVHGNLAALEAVLEDLDAVRPDEVLVGGDLVGRGPEGSAVVRRIADLGWVGVRGNHEDYLLDFRRGAIPAGWDGQEIWCAARWMANELDDDDAAYIDALPFSIASRLAPELRLVHGSPVSHNEGLGEWTTDAELDAHLERIGERVLVCGHTHRPMLREPRNGLVVNVGAVGLPFNRDPRAQYAILVRNDDGAWRVEFRRIPYDRERLFAAYRSSGFLDAGGVTVRLLRLEVEHAAPFLVPFIKWADAMDRPPESGALDAFLDFYDPAESLGTFIRRLRARSSGP